MASNFDSLYSANLIGLWDFKKGIENEDTGLGDGIAQDGTPVNDPEFSGGWLLNTGSSSFFKIKDGNDQEFDLNQGSIITKFKHFGSKDKEPDTVVSRGFGDGDGAGKKGELFEIRVTPKGAVEVFHADNGKEVLLSTKECFVGKKDLIEVTYSWDADCVQVKVVNQTKGLEFTGSDDQDGMTLDLTTGNQNSFVIGARQNDDCSYEQHFKGAIDFVAVLDKPVLKEGDGIVEGTKGDDLIDLAYTGDPEGDRIDNQDALLPGEAPNDDIVEAGAGNDTVKAGEGSDEVYGGEGDDVIDTSGSEPLPDRGFPGYGVVPPIPADPDPFDDRDSVEGGAGNDHITTGDDNDTILGGAGEDTIDGGLDDDAIRGGDDDDRIVGGEGADTIAGDGGDDVIYGGLDPVFPDALNIRDDGSSGAPDPDPGNGTDLIDGGAGDDIIFGQDDDDTILGGTGDDFVDGGIDNDLIFGEAGRDILLGDQGNDTLEGGGDTDLLLGEDGNDELLGQDGLDIIGGGAGDDTADGGADTDLVFGGDGNDSLTGGAESDLILGGAGDDTIFGDGESGEGNTADGAGDVLFGGAGDDRIVGGAGNDLIDGAEGADVQVGGADRDVFIEVGVGDDIDGSETGDDVDTLVINGPAIVDYDPTDPEAGTITFYDLETMTATGTAQFRNIENVRYVEHVVNPVSMRSVAPPPPPAGDAPEDAPEPPVAAPNSVEGVVDGTDGRDIIDLDYDGDPEGDRIDNGDAILPGEAPDDDIVQAGDGDDDVFSHEGNDDIFAGDGDDLVGGGNGNDIIRGEDGNDLLFGEVGNDQIAGGDGDDVIDGGLDNDIIEGGDGDDELRGNVGDDFLFGGDDDDTVSGGDGNDLIIGGQGDDEIDLGGADGDADLVFGNDDSDTFTGVGQGDTIDGGETGAVDFDVLDLTGSAEAVNPGGRLEIEYADANPEDGVVTYFNASGDVTGTTEFYNIENVVPCFTPGTLIATPKGERRVEDLEIGDRVITRDNGIQEIRWLGSRTMKGVDLKRATHLYPVRLREGALGNGLPERDMLVSPNHRVLVASDKTALYFEDREVLVSAKHLTGLEGVEVAEVPWVTYIHFMFDQHEVVLSDGAWTESFQPGDQTLDGLGNAQRNEIYELFPELKTREGREQYQAARRSLKKHEANLLTH